MLLEECKVFIYNAHLFWVLTLSSFLTVANVTHVALICVLALTADIFGHLMIHTVLATYKETVSQGKYVKVGGQRSVNATKAIFLPISVDVTLVISPMNVE